MTAFRRCKERLTFAGDERIDDETELIDQAGVDQVGRRSSATDEINVLAGSLLERKDVVESPEKAGVRPESRLHGRRQHIVRGFRGEAAPFDLGRGRRLTSERVGLV